MIRCQLSERMAYMAIARARIGRRSIQADSMGKAMDYPARANLAILVRFSACRDFSLYRLWT